MVDLYFFHTYLGDYQRASAFARAAVSTSSGVGMGAGWLCNSRYDLRPSAQPLGFYEGTTKLR